MATRSRELPSTEDSSITVRIRADSRVIFSAAGHKADGCTSSATNAPATTSANSMRATKRSSRQASRTATNTDTAPTAVAPGINDNTPQPRARYASRDRTWTVIGESFRGMKHPIFGRVSYHKI